MPIIIVDGCGALHLKQLTTAQHPALELVDALITKLDVQLRCTHGVYGEQVSMTLSQTLAAWQRVGRYQVETIGRLKRKALLNQLGKVRDMPGQSDIDLITLTHDQGAALFTHDTKAADVARLLKIPALDVIDLAGLLVEVGGEDWSTQERRLRGLHQADWRTSILQWKGGVETTLTSRERWPRLLDHLKRRWLPPA